MKRLVVAVGLVWLVTATPAAAATTYDVGEATSQFRNGACPDPAGNNITTIRAGDSVRWINCDSYAHDIAWDTPGLGDPPAQGPNESVVQSFRRAGFFDYHCEIHTGMTGRVIVQPAAASPTTKLTAPPSTTTTAANLTTATTAPATTATLGNVSGATTTSSNPIETTTTTEPDTTPITNKDRGASGVVVALTLTGIAAVAGGTVVVVRRLRAS